MLEIGKCPSCLQLEINIDSEWVATNSYDFKNNDKKLQYQITCKNCGHGASSFMGLVDACKKFKEPSQ